MKKLQKEWLLKLLLYKINVAEINHSNNKNKKKLIDFGNIVAMSDTIHNDTINSI